MNRRKAMKVAAGVFAGGGIGLVALSNAFKPEKVVAAGPSKIDFDAAETNWKYFRLDPNLTAELAYNSYSEGSCMYATVKSVITQLAEKEGEPYSSFPLHMFRYGHGGIGGYGSVCGTLNGAAAVLGLLIEDKSVRDKLISDIFQWYEKESFPYFRPENPNYDFTPPESVPNSVLCHASNTNWCNDSGFDISSKERKERCRRLTADVAQRVVLALNEIHSNEYITNIHPDEASGTCLACHGKEGKIKNSSVKMSCNSCHSESVGHRVFSDVHYKIMKE
jgi:hypothetical protein